MTVTSRSGQRRGGVADAGGAGVEPDEDRRPAWRRWGPRLARTALVVAVAVACWAAFVRQTRADPQRLAALAVTTPHMPGLTSRPALAKVLPTSGSTMAIVRRAVARDPGHTGIYEVEWQAPAASAVQADAGLLVQLLPTVSQAAQVLAQVRKQYGASRSVGGASYTLVGRFAVPGVAGAQGVTYHVAPSTASPSSAPNQSGTAHVVMFQVRAIAVVELVQTTGSTPGTTGAVALARAEAARLAAVPAGFSLDSSSRPLGWSVLVLGGGVVVGASAAAVPESVAAWRRRRSARRLLYGGARHELRASHRSLKRHQAPSWQRRPERRPPGWWPGRR